MVQCGFGMTANSRKGKEHPVQSNTPVRREAEALLGDEIIRRLREFTKALRSGKVERFTCRKIRLNLKPTEYSPKLVKQTRKILNVSQALFARFLGVSPKTVRAWEQGFSTPHDMACRFLDEIRRDPEHWRKRLLQSIEEVRKPQDA